MSEVEKAQNMNPHEEETIFHKMSQEKFHQQKYMKMKMYILSEILIQSQKFI